MLTDERDTPAKIPMIFVLQIRIDQTDNHTWYIKSLTDSFTHLLEQQMIRQQPKYEVEGYRKATRW